MKSIIMENYNSLGKKVFNFFAFFLTAPLIWLNFIPAVFMHLVLELYHQVNFRKYGIPLVNSKEYFKVDRHKLKYLNPLEKLFCMYCGYMNGLYPYAAKIASETERHWCAIRHRKSDMKEFIEPEYQKSFAEYGNPEEWKKHKVHKWTDKLRLKKPSKEGK